MIEDYLLEHYQKEEQKEEPRITIQNLYSGTLAAEGLPTLAKYLITKVFKPKYES
jgi:hypothetical protein